MPPRKKLAVVSTNFVKNDYRRSANSKKRTPRSTEINLGERYSNGKLKVTKWKNKYEWMAEKKAQLNDSLYLELLDPEELRVANKLTENMSALKSTEMEPALHFNAAHCGAKEFADALNRASLYMDDDDTANLARLEAFEMDLQNMSDEQVAKKNTSKLFLMGGNTLAGTSNTDLNENERNVTKSSSIRDEDLSNHAHGFENPPTLASQFPKPCLYKSLKPSPRSLTLQSPLQSKTETSDTAELVKIDKSNHNNADLHVDDDDDFYFLDEEEPEHDHKEIEEEFETLKSEHETLSLSELKPSSTSLSHLVASPSESLQKTTGIILRRVLRSVFGFSEFNPGQERAIVSVLSHQPTLLVLPTGGGKSLCYALPALLLPGLTLVVTPLISLMQDQMEKLPPQLPAASWSSALNAQQTEALMQSLRLGEIKILFVSPEKLLSPGFQRFMTRQLPAPGVSFACVDEAHCVSEWSHCFRPSYLRLAKVLFEGLNVKSVLGLTATATLQTQATVQRTLRVHRSAVHRASVQRPNLILSASCDPDRLQALDLLLHNEPFKSLDSIIIYVSTQMQCDALAQRLTAQGQKAVAYHAGRTPIQRAAAQERFMRGKIRIMVATIAFGMGLDKADVRAVIHYNMPRTLEHYVQEIGRAGRDGEPAFCHCFHNEEDAVKMLSLSHSDGVEELNIASVLKKVFFNDDYSSDKSGKNSFFSNGNETELTSVDPTTPYFVPLKIDEIEKSFDIKEQMVATLMAHLELIPSSTFEHILKTMKVKEITLDNDKNDDLTGDHILKRLQILLDELEDLDEHYLSIQRMLRSKSNKSNETKNDLVPLTSESAPMDISTLERNLARIREIQHQFTSENDLQHVPLSAIEKLFTELQELSVTMRREFPRFDPYAEVVSSIHNKVQIGFTKTHPIELAKRFPIIHELMRQNDHLSLFLNSSSQEESKNKWGKPSWYEATHAARESFMAWGSTGPSRYSRDDDYNQPKISSSAKFWEKRLNGGSKGSQRAGKFSLDLCEAANYLQCHVADVQRDLLKLKAEKAVTLFWSEQCYCIQVWRKPSDISLLSSTLFTKLGNHESAAVRKVRVVSVALKLLASTGVRDACISIRKRHLTMMQTNARDKLDKTTSPRISSTLTSKKRGIEHVSASSDSESDLEVDSSDVEESITKNEIKTEVSYNRGVKMEDSLKPSRLSRNSQKAVGISASTNERRERRETLSSRLAELEFADAFDCREKIEMFFEDDNDNDDVPDLSDDEGNKSKARLFESIKLKDRTLKGNASVLSNNPKQQSNTNLDSQTQNEDDSGDSDSNSDNDSDSSISSSDEPDIIILSEDEDLDISFGNEAISSFTTDSTNISSVATSTSTSTSVQQAGISFYDTHSVFRAILSDYFESENEEFFLEYLEKATNQRSSYVPFSSTSLTPMLSSISPFEDFGHIDPLALGSNILRATKHTSIEDVISPSQLSAWTAAQEQAQKEWILWAHNAAQWRGSFAQQFRMSPPVLVPSKGKESEKSAKTDEKMSKKMENEKDDKRSERKGLDFAETTKSWVLRKPTIPLPPFSQMSTEMRGLVTSLRTFIRTMIIPLVEARDEKIMDYQDQIVVLRERIEKLGQNVQVLQSKLERTKEEDTTSPALTSLQSRLSKAMDSLENAVISLRSRTEDLRAACEVSLSAVYTARSVARVFHGLHSPAFPSSGWKKTSYWGEYFRVEFDTVKHAAEWSLYEVMKMHLSLQERKQEKEAQMLANVRKALSKKNNVGDDNGDNSDAITSDIERGGIGIDVTASDDCSDDSDEGDIDIDIIVPQSVNTEHLSSAVLSTTFLLRESSVDLAPPVEESDDEIIDLSMFGV